jgi:hypothetical protein
LLAGSSLELGMDVTMAKTRRGSVSKTWRK